MFVRGSTMILESEYLPIQPSYRRVKNEKLGEGPPNREKWTALFVQGLKTD